MCEPATGRIFLGANGMATTADRTTIFVNDPGFPPIHQRRIHVMRTSDTHSQLEPIEIVEPPHAADNIEYDDASGELIMGTMPLGKEALDHAANKSTPVAGGMISMKRSGGSWAVEAELNQDGEVLHGATSAVVRLGKRVVLGSPTAPGILVCDS